MAGEAEFEKGVRDAEKALRGVALAARDVPEAKRAVEEGLKLVTAARNAQAQKRFTVAFERLTAARGKALEAEAAKLAREEAAAAGKTPPAGLPAAPGEKVKPVPVQGVSAARGTPAALLQEGKAMRGLAEQALQKGETAKALELIGKAEKIEALARGRLAFMQRLQAEVIDKIRKHPFAAIFGGVAGIFAVYIGKLTTFPAFIFEETAQQAGANLWGFTDKDLLSRIREGKVSDAEYQKWEDGVEAAFKLLQTSAEMQDEFNASPWMWVAPPARDSYRQFAATTWGKVDSTRFLIDNAKIAYTKAKAAERAKALGKPAPAPAPAPAAEPGPAAAQPPAGGPAQESKGPARSVELGAAAPRVSPPVQAAPPAPGAFTGTGTFSPEELHAYTALPEEDRERYRGLDTKSKHAFRVYLHEHGTAPPK